MALKGSVAISVKGQALKTLEKAKALAQELNLPLADEGAQEVDLLLLVTDQRLELKLMGPGAPGPIYVDFKEGACGYMRRLNPFGMMIKAVCLKDKQPMVMDATAGLGGDAFILAHKGCQVKAIERSPLLAALISDGLERAKTNLDLKVMLEQRFTLICGDARRILKGTPPNQAPDVIYMDPMFPPKKKSALVKKEMRVVRSLVGDDSDSLELLTIAKTIAKSHVVVKRMRHAPVLEPNPTQTFQGKTTRYDIYQK